MLKSIFFDLDETLLDFTRAEAVALSRALRCFGREPTDQIIRRYHVLNISQWRLMEEGKLSREGVLTRRFELLFEEMGWPAEQVPAFNDRYEIFLGQGHYFLPGAEDLLKELAPQYDLYLATNGASAVQRGRLKSAGIEPYFKGIFISGEVGYNKPSREYFQTAFAAIPNFDPAAAVIVGDSLTSDIRGGINAGLKTVWVNPSHKENHTEAIPDYEIESITQLQSLLETL